MSPAQTKLYWREWAAVRRSLLTAGWEDSEIPAERAACTRRALGRAKSSKFLTNSDFDKILSEFRAISRPDDLQAQLDGTTEAGERRRLLHSISHSGLDQAYLDRIARDQFRLTPWQELPLDQLRKFRFTVKSRSTSRRRKAS